MNILKKILYGSMIAASNFSCRVAGLHHGIPGSSVITPPQSNHVVIKQPEYFYNKNGEGCEVLQEGQPYLMILDNNTLANHVATLPNGYRPVLKPGQAVKIDMVTEQNKAAYETLFKQYGLNYNLKDIKFKENVVVNLVDKMSPCGVEQIRFQGSRTRPIMPQINNGGILPGALYMGLTDQSSPKYGQPSRLQQLQPVCQIIEQQRLGYRYEAPMGNNSRNSQQANGLSQAQWRSIIFGANVRSMGNRDGTRPVGTRNQQGVTSTHAVVIIPEKNRP